ncbi:unnamed protein product [Parnassius apollo]|uniref:(apollo) hypothetical protein n=1 Tax=Parnassius apollo TaxID=110799 RepID=A0A8S3W9R9_PARAO|nr:unnamed protein product [Parnassius apollo]
MPTILKFRWYDFTAAAEGGEFSDLTMVKFRWYDFTAAAEGGEFSDLTMVSKFLNIEADKCGAFATSEEKSGFRRTHRQATHSTREKDFKERDSRQSTEKTENCPMCQGGYFLVNCQKFQKTSVQDRWATVKKSHVCFKCLQGKHRKESCEKPPCKECKRSHHHLLHVESEDRTSGEKKAETQEEVASVMTSVNAVNNARAYLKIVPVEIFGPKGSKRILVLVVRVVQFMNTCLHVSTPDEEMHQAIKDHFAIEALGVQLRRPTTDSEGRSRRLENGRFEAGLLWKNEDEQMPESYTSAKNRLFNIEKKIDKDPQLKAEYVKQIQHLIDSK